MQVLAISFAVFVVGAAASLATSWVLVRRIECLGERFGLSEALLGLVAAVAADAPEITSAVSAVVQRQRSVGVGIVLGSNLFNLAALLGLAALVAGEVRFHRRVVVFAGGVSVAVAVLCELAVTRAVPVAASLGGVLAVIVLYGGALALGVSGLVRLRLPATWCDWIGAAVEEEGEELHVAMPPPGGGPDAVVAAICLAVVIVASVAMERAATALGQRWSVPGIVLGGVVLAAVTSLPNAVAAVYLALRRRGTAVLGTALDSNIVNVACGLLLPASFLGLGPVSASGTLVASSYLGLTVLSLALVFVGQGLSRRGGGVIVLAYLAVVASLLAVAY
jgi:cation:H+ antiporter